MFSCNISIYAISPMFLNCPIRLNLLMTGEKKDTSKNKKIYIYNINELSIIYLKK
jgi:hypothetical protein